MKTTISPDEAIQIWNKYLQSPHLKLHTLESEAIMRKLARHFGEDENYWGIAGLLHDLDMDILNGNYSEHGYKTVEILKNEGYDLPEMFKAIIAHTEGVSGHDARRESRFDYVLAAAENITGIISAYVVIKPDKKIAGTKLSSIKKKLKSKAFAASVNREFIYDIEKSGLELSNFLELSVSAMSEIADDIGM